MKKISLAELINENTIIPIEDETITEIEERCKTLSSTISFEDYSNIILFFLNINKTKTEFIKEIHHSLPESFGNLKENNSILRLILGYIINYNIETQDPKKSAIISLMFHNALILKRNNFQDIVGLKIFENIYWKYDNYTLELEPSSNIESLHFIDVLEKNEFSFFSQQDIRKEIKQVYYDSAELQIYNTIDNFKKNEDDGDFLFAYNLAKTLALELRWPYVNIDICSLIKKLFDKKGYKKKMDLANIIDDLKKSINLEKKVSETSIVLYHISNTNNGAYNEDLTKAKYTPLEICVYLYYEMILERILNEE